MSIQKCLNCGEQFLWKEVQKNTIECQKCGTAHTVTMKTKSLFALCAGVIVLIIDLNILFTVIGIIAIGLLYPFFVKYKVRQSNK